MAKKAYIGVNNVAKNIKNGYIGVNNVARKLKRGYIGDGTGKARLFFSKNKTVTKQSNATELSTRRYEPASTTVGSYAIIAGGYTGSVATDAAESYNTSLTMTKRTALTNARRNMVATTVGNYALFAGGCTTYYYGSSKDAIFNTVDRYNSSMVKGTASSLSVKRNELAATTVGSYAIFAGGSSTPLDSAPSYYKIADAYNTSLTKQSSVPSLSIARSKLAAATVGNYALFAGGCSTTGNDIDSNATYYSTVDTYNTSLTRSTATSLRYKCCGTCGAGNSKYAIFAGGDTSIQATGTSDSANAIMHYYNTSLTRGYLTLATKRVDARALGYDEFFFIGADALNSEQPIDVYNASLTRTTITLSLPRFACTIAYVGNYILFAGGRYDGSRYGTCEVFSIQEE